MALKNLIKRVVSKVTNKSSGSKDFGDTSGRSQSTPPSSGGTSTPNPSSSGGSSRGGGSSGGSITTSVIAPTIQEPIKVIDVGSKSGQRTGSVTIKGTGSNARIVDVSGRISRSQAGRISQQSKSDSTPTARELALGMSIADTKERNLPAQSFAPSKNRKGLGRLRGSLADVKSVGELKQAERQRAFEESLGNQLGGLANNFQTPYVGDAQVIPQSTPEGISYTILPSESQILTATGYAKEKVKEYRPLEGLGLVGGGATLLASIGKPVSQGADLIFSGGRQAVRDTITSSKGTFEVLTSPQSFEGGRIKTAFDTFTGKGTKSADFVSSFRESAIESPVKGAAKIGFVIGDFGYEKITGRQATGNVGAYFDYDRERRLRDDPDVRAAVVTVGTFGVGSAFGAVGGGVVATGSRIGGVTGARIGQGLVLGTGLALGGGYAYDVTKRLSSSSSASQSGEIVGSSIREALAFGGGARAGARAGAKATEFFLPRYTEGQVVKIDATLEKPIAFRSEFKVSNTYFDSTIGKIVNVQKGASYSSFSEIAVSGRTAGKVNTPFRELFGKEPYSRKDSIGFLKRQGLTEYQSSQALREFKPKDVLVFERGTLDVQTIGDSVPTYSSTGKRSLIYLEGESGGLKFSKRRTTSIDVLETGKIVNSKSGFSYEEINPSARLGRQTKRGEGLGLYESKGKGDINLIVNTLEGKGFNLDLYKTGTFERFGTSTITREYGRSVPSRKRPQFIEGEAFVKQGEPIISISFEDLSITEARGFKGKGSKSSNQFYDNLYRTEQTILPPQTKPPITKNLKSDSTSNKDGINSILSRGNFRLPLVVANQPTNFLTNFGSGFTKTFSSQEAKQKAQALTQTEQAIGVGLLDPKPSLNVNSYDYSRTLVLQQPQQFTNQYQNLGILSALNIGTSSRPKSNTRTLTRTLTVEKAITSNLQLTIPRTITRPPSFKQPSFKQPSFKQPSFRPFVPSFDTLGLSTRPGRSSNLTLNFAPRYTPSFRASTFELYGDVPQRFRGGTVDPFGTRYIQNGTKAKKSKRKKRRNNDSLDLGI